MAEWCVPSETTTNRQTLCREKSFSLESISSLQKPTTIKRHVLIRKNSFSLDSINNVKISTATCLSDTMLPCKLCGAERRQDDVTLLRNQPAHRQYTSSSNEDSYHQLRLIRNEIDEVRRENNRMVLEAAYLRKENNAYAKRLKEEHVLRERSKSQLEHLRRKLDSRPPVFDSETFDRDLISNDDIIKEQLKAYREDFYAEKREREKYRERNIELERQLEESKKTLEMQQKKLLLYSQIISQPLHKKLDLPVSMSTKTQHRTTLDTPHSPSRSPPRSPPTCSKYSIYEKKDKKQTCIIVDLPKDYQTNDHILEATLLSGEKPRIKRATTPPAYFRGRSQDQLTDRFSSDYEWSLKSEDVVLK